MVSRRAPAPRRETEWFTTQQGFLGLTADTQDNLTLFNAAQIGARFMKGTTITRMIVDLTIRSPSVG